MATATNAMSDIWSEPSKPIGARQNITMLATIIAKTHAVLSAELLRKKIRTRAANALAPVTAGTKNGCEMNCVGLPVPTLSVALANGSKHVPAEVALAHPRTPLSARISTEAMNTPIEAKITIHVYVVSGSIAINEAMNPGHHDPKGEDRKRHRRATIGRCASSTNEVKECRHVDLNHGPTAYEAAALTAELCRHGSVGARRRVTAVGGPRQERGGGPGRPGARHASGLRAVYTLPDSGGVHGQEAQEDDPGRLGSRQVQEGQDEDRVRPTPARAGARAFARTRRPAPPAYARRGTRRPRTVASPGPGSAPAPHDVPGGGPSRGARPRPMLSFGKRPRELAWYHAGPMLFGDWGTSRLYVLGIAFAASGSGSLLLRRP